MPWGGAQVLGRGQSSPSGADNTLLNICIPHESGSLAKVLNTFAKHSVNLSAIESFPDRDSARRCFVWTEVEGHTNDPSVQSAMAELQACSTTVQVLGSFPRDNNRDVRNRTRTLEALTADDKAVDAAEETADGSAPITKRQRTSGGSGSDGGGGGTCAA